jgi:hypothetical protein
VTDEIKLRECREAERWMIILGAMAMERWPWWEARERERARGQN